MTFQDCNLIPQIVRALTEQGYTEPTAIQAGAIVPALEGRDILGTARTGTGKTCAFAAPILQLLHQRGAKQQFIRALVLTPTRELAIQNQDCFEAYGKYLPLRSTVIFGGVGQQPQADALRKGVDILVATPGRLADLYQQGLIDLSRLEIFVLDEADRMLDMGFIHDVKRILRWLPAKKQTLFFSATMPPELHELVESLLHNPVHVSVDPVNTTVDAIAQSVYRVDKGNKTNLLVRLLAENHWPSVLVFTRTKHGANKVARDLERAGVSSAAIHGNKSQTARQAALAGFKAGEIRVLVATDLAARGLDIEDLSCVVNYNLPEVPETYVHRIGRTGRAGKDGVAVSFCNFDEGELLCEIEKLTRQKIPVVENHPYPMQQTEPAPRDKNGRVVNAEDQEAREAAREHAKAARGGNPARRAEQLAEAQAKRQKRKHPVPDAVMPEPALAQKAEPPVEKPAGNPAEKAAKHAKKGKKSAPVQPVAPEDEEAILHSSVPEFFGVDLPGLLPEREVEPEAPYDESDILHRKPKKPERRVIPALNNVSLLPTFELKETFGSKLREDSQSFRMEGALDATDRMFRASASPLPQETETGKHGKHGGKTKKHQSDQPVQAAPQQAAESGKKPKGGAQKVQNAAPPANRQERRRAAGVGKHTAQAAPEPWETGKRPAKGAFPGAQKHAKRRVPGAELRPSRVKDSTEQESLMKPYYLSDVEHKK